MDIWYVKIKGHKIKHLEIRLTEQLNEIIELNHKIEGNGIYIADIMHVFKANNPTSQLESGQQNMDIAFARNSQKHCPYHALTKHISSWSYIKSMFNKCNK